MPSGASTASISETPREEADVIRALNDVPDNVLAVQAVGKVTDADSESVPAPAATAWAAA